jgi:hypothetical protein
MPDGTLNDTAQDIPQKTGPRRIAILGSAPSSLNLAPFQDPTWKIWGCSGGTAPHCKRVDAWFEAHDFDTTRALFSPEYLAFLRSGAFPVYMADAHPEIPTSKKFPREELLQAFGPFFFTSTISWMLAYALHFEDPIEIGLWGIDLAAGCEYEYQRPGAHHFISVARHRGIKVTVPPQADILKPPPMYGFMPVDPMTAKAITKTAELAAMHAQARN